MPVSPRVPSSLFSNPSLDARDLEIAVLQMEQRLDSGNVIQPELLPLELLPVEYYTPASPLLAMRGWGEACEDDAEATALPALRGSFRPRLR